MRPLNTLIQYPKSVQLTTSISSLQNAYNRNNFNVPQRTKRFHYQTLSHIYTSPMPAAAIDSRNTYPHPPEERIKPSTMTGQFSPTPHASSPKLNRLSGAGQK